MEAWISVRLFLLSSCLSITFGLPLAKKDVHCAVRHKTGAPIDLDSRVVGGHPISIQERPYQVLVLIRHGSIINICGGVIYRREWILSAAHCFFTDGNTTSEPGDIRVRAGKTHLNKTDPTEVNLRVMEVIIHERFLSDNADIALLRLSSCLEYNDYIKPLTLVSTHPALAEGKVPATISGWGQTKKIHINGQTDPSSIGFHLQLASIHFISNDQCVRDFANFDPAKLYPEGTPPEEYSWFHQHVDHVPPTAICGTADEIDTCGGDSGGPMVCELPGEPPGLCGLVSFGYGCALGIPGVYTDVFQFRNWIQQNLKESCGAVGE